MNRIDTRRGRTALMVAHCAGMVDLVALPVWIGTLVARYGFDPQQAGGLATLFLLGAVCASALLGPRFGRLPGRAVATAAFGTAALAFFAVSATTAFGTMAVLHALAGLSIGAALSVTHGTIARSARPHRLFAFAGTALGVFAVVFLGSTPPIVAAGGGPVLFWIFGGIMAVAAGVMALGFPSTDAPASGPGRAAVAPRLSPAVWCGVFGMGGMTVVQAMTFSFLERVGSDRGFGLEAITGVLVALGLVSLIPAPLAAVLEKRWPARTVMIVGPMLQAALCIVVMNATAFAPYAVAASLFATVIIFTHTFAFGLLARLDTSGRALAIMPSTLMLGSAIGPLLGGTLVKYAGYGSLGMAALVIASITVAAFTRLPSSAPAPAFQKVSA